MIIFADIFLNIIVPLGLLLWIGFFVYRSGRFIKGALLTWAALSLFQFTSLLLGILAELIFYPGLLDPNRKYGEMFQDGPGLFATLCLGWVPGILVSSLAMLARYLRHLIKG